MGQAQRRREADHQITDIVVSGVESVTDIGGEQVRVVYYVNRPGENGRLERVLLDIALVMPKSMIADAIGKAMLAISRKVIARPDGSLTVAH